MKSLQLSVLLLGGLLAQSAIAQTPATFKDGAKACLRRNSVTAARPIERARVLTLETYRFVATNARCPRGYRAIATFATPELVQNITQNIINQTPQLLAGPVGAKGDTGAQGPQGPQGPQGISGAVGAQGVKGDKGDTGPQGAKGADGTNGINGAKGDKGDTGAQGLQGLKGDTGAAGPAGAVGPQGTQGERGLTGATGAQGAAGPQGPQGPQGERGFTGLTGATGAQGLQGVAGPAGATGPQGPAGAAADMTLVNNINTRVNNLEVYNQNTTIPRLTTIENRLNDGMTGLQALKNRIEAVNTYASAIDTDRKQVELGLTNRVTALEGRSTNVETRVTNVENRVTEIQGNKQDRLNYFSGSSAMGFGQYLNDIDTSPTGLGLSFFPCVAAHNPASAISSSNGLVLNTGGGLYSITIYGRLKGDSAPRKASYSMTGDNSGLAKFGSSSRQGESENDSFNVSALIAVANGGQLKIQRLCQAGTSGESEYIYGVIWHRIG